MANHPWEVMSGVNTLSVIDRRRPLEIICGVDLVNKKALTYYGEVIGALRLHPRKSARSRVQRARLYAMNSDLYVGCVYLTAFVYGVFRRVS